MSLVKIPLSSIAIGKPLNFELHSKDGALLASKGYVINSRQTLENLNANQPIYVDNGIYFGQASKYGLGLDNDANNRLNDLMNQDVSIEKISEIDLSSYKIKKISEFHVETDHLDDGHIDWYSLQLRTNLILRDADSQKSVMKINRLYNDLSIQVKKEPDASLLTLIYLSATDPEFYSATHALLVSSMCILVVRDVLKWSEQDQDILGLAALTMNYAMTEMQDKLSKQKGPLSQLQIKFVNEHPRNSVDLLSSLGVKDSNWLDAIFHHHTTEPGPLESRDKRMQMARLIQRADVFAAKLAPRAARTGMPTPLALKAAYFDELKNVDEAGVALVKAVGVYPPGSFVKLANGEIGIVIKRGNKTNYPLIAVFISKSGMYLSTPIGRQTDSSNFKIVESLLFDNNKFRINLDSIYKVLSRHFNDSLHVY